MRPTAALVGSQQAISCLIQFDRQSSDVKLNPPETHIQYPFRIPPKVGPRQDRRHPRAHRAPRQGARLVPRPHAARHRAGWLLQVGGGWIGWIGWIGWVAVGGWRSAVGVGWRLAGSCWRGACVQVLAAAAALDNRLTLIIHIHRNAHQTGPASSAATGPTSPATT